MRHICIHFLGKAVDWTTEVTFLRITLDRNRNKHVQVTLNKANSAPEKGVQTVSRNKLGVYPQNPLLDVQHENGTAGYCGEIKRAVKITCPTTAIDVILGLLRVTGLIIIIIIM